MANRSPFLHNSPYLWGFADTESRLKIKSQFSRVSPFKEGIARVYVDGGKYSFIDKKDTLIAPFVYSSAEDFSEGAAFVKKDRNSNGFFINSNGQLISKNTYNYAGNFHCGLAHIGTGIVWP